MRNLIFTFGRFQPPTIGHIEHFQFMKNIAEYFNDDCIVFVSNTVDNNRNPVYVNGRIDYIKKAVPGLEVQSATNMFQIIEDLPNIYQGVKYVVGDEYFESQRGIQMLNDLEKHAIKHNLEFKAITSGKRYHTSNAIEYHLGTDEYSISGTNMRQAAVNDNWAEFVAFSPLNVGKITTTDVRNMFILVRDGNLNN